MDLDDYTIHSSSTQYGWLKSSESIVVYFENITKMYKDDVSMIGRLYIKTVNNTEYWYIWPENKPKSDIKRIYFSKKNFRILSPENFKKRYPQCII